jgi:hypothetical protein
MLAQNKIALLFGVPVSKAEFMQRSAESDYLRKYYLADAEQDQRALHLETAWDREYAPWTADPLSRTMEAALRLGVTIYSGATLASLQDATESHEVAILFSHWKGSEISNDDFIQPVSERLFRNGLDGCNAVPGNWLLEQFDKNRIGDDPEPASVWHRIASVFSAQRAGLREILEALLTAKIDDGAEAVDGIDQVLETDATRSARRREYLNRQFPGLLYAGNRLELFDGLHSKEKIESAIAPAFEGILDLTTCTSTVLADFISNCRRARLRTVQFPTVQEPLWAALHISRTLEIVAAFNLPYLEARLRAQHELEQDLAAMATGERK